MRQQTAVDTESTVKSQRSGGKPPISNFQDVSKHQAVEHQSPNTASGVDPKAESTTDQNAKVLTHGSYGCTSDKHSGRLSVTSLGISFKPAVGAKEQWQLSYDDIHRVKKVRIIDTIFLSLSLFRPLTDLRNYSSNRPIASSKRAPAKTYYLLMDTITRSRYLMSPIGTKCSRKSLGIAKFDGKLLGRDGRRSCGTRQKNRRGLLTSGDCQLPLVLGYVQAQLILGDQIVVKILLKIP